jgi:hypothetical protein
VAVGAARCRGSVTGWNDLPARKADYGELVAPYLRTMDDEIQRGNALRWRRRSPVTTNAMAARRQAQSR